jgi:hypothetical protein
MIKISKVYGHPSNIPSVIFYIFASEGGPLFVLNWSFLYYFLNFFSFIYCSVFSECSNLFNHMEVAETK